MARVFVDVAWFDGEDVQEAQVFIDLPDGETSEEELFEMVYDTVSDGGRVVVEDCDYTVSSIVVER